MRSLLVAFAPLCCLTLVASLMVVERTPASQDMDVDTNVDTDVDDSDAIISEEELDKPRVKPEEHVDRSKYAYVTMYMDKEKIGAGVRLHENTMTKEEEKQYITTLKNDLTEDSLPMDLAKSGEHVEELAEKFPEAAFEKYPNKKTKPRTNIPLEPRSGPAGVLDMYKSLQGVGSKYPLVVLTNADIFFDKRVPVKFPNLVVIPVEDQDMIHRGCKMKKGHEIHFQKLKIFNMTQYDKLIWLDTDLAFVNNVDRLFDLNVKGGKAAYGQQDDYGCRGSAGFKGKHGGGFCSGLMVFGPSEETFSSIMKFQKHMGQCWGDQAIIGKFFNQGGHSSHLLPRSTVNFEHCRNKMDVLHFSGSPRALRTPQDAPIFD